MGTIYFTSDHVAILLTFSQLCICIDYRVEHMIGEKGQIDGRIMAQTLPETVPERKRTASFTESDKRVAAAAASAAPIHPTQLKGDVSNVIKA